PTGRSARPRRTPQWRPGPRRATTAYSAISRAPGGPDRLRAPHRDADCGPGRSAGYRACATAYRACACAHPCGLSGQWRGCCPPFVQLTPYPRQALPKGLIGRGSGRRLLRVTYNRRMDPIASHGAEDSPLGRPVAYRDRYAPELLFPIDRQTKRDELGVRADALPFAGEDVWNA